MCMHEIVFSDMVSIGLSVKYTKCTYRALLLMHKLCNWYFSKLFINENWFEKSDSLRTLKFNSQFNWELNFSV